MRTLESQLGLWSGVVGLALTVGGVIHSRNWVAVLGAVILAIAALIGFHAWRIRNKIKQSTIEIQGRRIDSLNVANLSRRRNQTLGISRAAHAARIQDEDLEILLEYEGHCASKNGETVFEFSVDSESFVPFASLDCFAFDLCHDPHRSHRIRPMLVGPDGISKKLAVPFAQPLAYNSAFHVALVCKLPQCMKFGVDYFESTLSFAQSIIQSYTVAIEFSGTFPSWVRVYECSSHGSPRLLRDLTPAPRQSPNVIYYDEVHDSPGQSARIYVFHRTEG